MTQKQVLAQVTHEWKKSSEIAINLPTGIDAVNMSLMLLEKHGLIESVRAGNGWRLWRLKRG